MSAPDPRHDLAHWLRGAYAAEAAGCPPPEAFLPEEMAALPAEQAHRLEVHADGCPACGVERELARGFDAAAPGVVAEDVDWVVAQLRGAPSAAPSQREGNLAPGRVVPFRGRAAVRVWTRLAAAAVLVIAAGVTFRALLVPAPPLPRPPIGGPVRGGEMATVAPMGELVEVPRELRWVPLPGAATYRVQLMTMDDTQLWQTRVTGPSAHLPSDVAARLQRAVSYAWMVEATAPDGAVLARSAPARFRIRPAPEATPPLETGR